MNPTPMEDPAVKALAFDVAYPLVVETLDAIANASDRSLAARAQGFGLKRRIRLLDDDDRTELEAQVESKAYAIASDQIKRLLSVTQRFEFEDGLKARNAYDAQAREAAEKLSEDRAESNG